MKIDVQLFARARDIARASQLTVDLPEKATIGDLRRRLRDLVPALAKLLECSALAVAEELANDEFVLTPGAVVALLPPVSGG